jgi:hypothetical protein
VRYDVTIVNANRNDGLAIDPGESIALPLSFKNPDGSTRNMSGATISAKVFNASTGIEETGAASVSNGVLGITAEKTLPWRGTYKVEIIILENTVTSIGAFRLLVKW